MARQGLGVPYVLQQPLLQQPCQSFRAEVMTLGLDVGAWQLAGENCPEVEVSQTCFDAQSLGSGLGWAPPQEIGLRRHHGMQCELQRRLAREPSDSKRPLGVRLEAAHLPSELDCGALARSSPIAHKNASRSLWWRKRVTGAPTDVTASGSSKCHASWHPCDLQ